jgi:AcrR family transcriptional regulator
VPPDPATLPSDQLARRARIVEAAVALMTEREYDKVQVRDVAERGGVSLRTLYRYFASKEHLLAEALVAWSESYRRRTAELDPDAGDRENLRRALHRAVRAFERQPLVYGALLALQRSDDPLARERYQHFADEQRVALTGLLRGVDPADRDGVVRLLMALLDAQLREWTLGRVPIDEVHASLDHAVGLVLSDRDVA